MNIPNILAIDTSADDTCVAVTQGRRILSNARFSQISLHAEFGGIYPTIAKRAHQEHIDAVVKRALRLSRKNWKEIDYIAVTYGPGLAPALDVGVKKAKELAESYGKQIIPVNHMEGHFYSCFAQNSQGNPDRPMQFPILSLLVSGGHTELILMKEQGNYQILGETQDDAAGEALDKAARLLTGGGYPGGPVIEKLARTGDPKFHHFTRPMMDDSYNYSYSGIKTALLYLLESYSQQEKLEHLNDIAASFQEAVFDSLLKKLDRAVAEYKPAIITIAGGVSANTYLRKKSRALLKKHGVAVYFPSFKTVEGDNAAMIGIAGYFAYEKGRILKDFSALDRIPRSSLASLKY